MKITLQYAHDFLQKATESIKKQEFAIALNYWKQALAIFQDHKTWDNYLSTAYLIAQHYKKQQQNDKALAVLHNSLQQTTTKASVENKGSVVVYNLLIEIYEEATDYLKAIYYLKLLLKIYENQTSKEQEEISHTYNNIGWCYSQRGDYEKALFFYEKALQVCLQYLGNNHKDTAISYNNIGFCYGERKNHMQALHFYEKALHIWSLNMADEQLLSYAYNNIGSCYRKMDKHEQAISYYEKALVLAKKHKQQKIVARIYSNLGCVYDFQANFETAIDWHTKALKQQQKLLGECHYNTILTYHNLGVCYRKAKLFPLAFVHLQKALALAKKLVAANHPLMVLLKNTLGTYWKFIGDFREAIKHYTEVIKCLAIDNTFASTSLLDYKNPQKLLYALEAKAYNLQQIYNTELSDLKLLLTAFKTYQHAFFLLNLIGQSYKVEYSKLQWLNDGISVYKRGISLTYQLFQETKETSYLHQAFQFSEQCKAILLLSSFQESKAKILANIPIELLDREKELQVNLRLLEKKISQAQYQENGVKELVISEWKSQYFDTEQLYQALIEQLEKEYPAYYQAKKQIPTVSIDQLQEKIRTTKMVILSYFVAQNNLYIFIVTKNDYQVVEIIKPTDLEELIQSFQTAMEFMDIEDFAQISHQLYQLLVAPCTTILDKHNIEQLIIIRDDHLHYLPFDALVTQEIVEPTEFYELPYLIQQYSISYHYSASLLLQVTSRQAERQTTPAFLGFAPVNFTNDLEDLPNSLEEIKQVEQLFTTKQFKTKLLVQEQATKSSLQKAITKENYQYLLLSTHGLLDKEAGTLSGIYVTPTDKEDTLHTNEVYNINLTSDLVVLSSCSSGIGKLYKGEGMMALNRAFLYAGANNIIFTQFDIPDETSSQLVIQFFEYVLQGCSYPKALQLAKLALLENDSYTVEDWAGFALIGTLL